MNLFVLCQNISDFVPSACNAPRNPVTLLTFEFIVFEETLY